MITVDNSSHELLMYHLSDLLVLYMMPIHVYHGASEMVNDLCTSKLIPHQTYICNN